VPGAEAVTVEGGAVLRGAKGRGATAEGVTDVIAGGAADGAAFGASTLAPSTGGAGGALGALVAFVAVALVTLCGETFPAAARRNGFTV
jgi:hypothetical protein